MPNVSSSIVRDQALGCTTPQGQKVVYKDAGGTYLDAYIRSAGTGATWSIIVPGLSALVTGAPVNGSYYTAGVRLRTNVPVATSKQTTGAIHPSVKTGWGPTGTGSG